ncbi:MAG: hypothetical protein AAF337_14735 [Pseudomonadota bacterium]
MTVQTTAANARCSLARDNEEFAYIVSTPETLTVKKTKHDIDITCTKPGYYDAKHSVDSGVELMTFGNVLIGGLVGWGVDSALGADNKYSSNVMVQLQEDPDQGRGGQGQFLLSRYPGQKAYRTIDWVPPRPSDDEE